MINPTIAEAARKQLRGVPPSPFDQEALPTLQVAVERYIDDLIIESIRIMKRRGSRTVSSEYVTTAAQNVVRGRGRKLLTIVGALGGGSLSAAFTYLWESAKTGNLAISNMVVVFVLFAAGVVLLGFQMSRD